jgi:hypothetical protein
MMELSYRRHRFRRSSSSMWLYLRFTLSYRDVEDLIAERGLDPQYAIRLLAQRNKSRTWRVLGPTTLLFPPAIRRRFFDQHEQMERDAWRSDETESLIAVTSLQACRSASFRAGPRGRASDTGRYRAPRAAPRSPPSPASPPALPSG